MQVDIDQELADYNVYESEWSNKTVLYFLLLYLAHMLTR